MNVFPSQGFQALTMWQKLPLFCQKILDNGDKRTDNWLLVYSPVPIIWRKLMAKRQPVNLKPMLLVYNFQNLQTVFLSFQFIASSWLDRYNLLCHPVDYSNNPLSRLIIFFTLSVMCWWFYFSKVIELSDAVSKQGEERIYGITCNAHPLYMFTAELIGLISSLVHSVTKYLWWKHYLTSLQLLQFFIVTIHITYNLFADCDFPDSMNMVVLVYSVSFIVFLGNFHYHNYLAKRKTKTT
uniref:Elongation of very long chain fatty acids protein n=1 Tax=Monopterus albus TaxID=43700 RepID=A0A3Q3QJL9_MONAL